MSVPTPSLSPFLQTGVAIFFLFTSISTRDLDVESWEVFHALEKGDLALARVKVSMIVGRDTAHLDEPEIIRATVETIAENTVDGIISPLFYAMSGGVPLAVAYRAVNTLDAMIGHQTPRYILFGRVAARVDHLLNYFPVRLSGVLFPIAAGLSGFSGRGAWRTAWTDGAKSGHANSGIPEAAMAGALQVQLGGLSFYGGEERRTSLLGTSDQPLQVRHISQAIRVMYVCSVLTFMLVLVMRGFWL
jgi:adenosylcobinamide-phosphate synthase